MVPAADILQLAGGGCCCRKQLACGRTNTVVSMMYGRWALIKLPDSVDAVPCSCLALESSSCGARLPAPVAAAAMQFLTSSGCSTSYPAPDLLSITNSLGITPGATGRGTSAAALAAAAAAAASTAAAAAAASAAAAAAAASLASLAAFSSSNSSSKASAAAATIAGGEAAADGDVCKPPPPAVLDGFDAPAVAAAVPDVLVVLLSRDVRLPRSLAGGSPVLLSAVSCLLCHTRTCPPAICNNSGGCHNDHHTKPLAASASDML